MTMSVRGTVGAVCLLASLTACSAGGRGSPTGPSRAVETFEAAMKQGDAGTACGLLAPPTRKELEQSQSEKCAKALPDQNIPAATSEADVEVFGDEAIARVAGDVCSSPTSAAPGWCTPPAASRSRTSRTTVR